MIITIAGKVTHKGNDFVVIETGGLGYQVFLHDLAIREAHIGSTAKLWTHEYIREDARELYGFVSEAEYSLFRKLLAISGVGPKMALNILSLGTVKDIEAMIENGDVAKISSLPGIGKKTAQKIILELKGRLVDDDGESNEDQEVIAALVNLGYPKEKARDALSRVPAGSDAGVEDRLRAALRELGK